MSAIENDTLVPQFQSLCAITHVHTVLPDIYVRLLVPVLSKPCAIIVLGIQLVQKMSSRVDWNRILFSSCPCVLSCFVGMLFVVCLDPSLAKMAVNLHAAHKKITRVFLTIVQHTNYYSCAELKK